MTIKVCKQDLELKIISHVVKSSVFRRKTLSEVKII